MGKRLAAIILIFIGISIGWMILGGTVQNRTDKQDSALKEAVGQLWGSSQNQKAPLAYYQVSVPRKVEVQKDGKTIIETEIETQNFYVPLEQSDIKVDFDLEHRKKGLLWYSTYRVRFDGKYRIANNTAAEQTMLVDFAFPNANAVYDDFKLVVGGKKIEDIKILEGMINTPIKLGPGQSQNISFSYITQGMDDWCYDFGDTVSQVKNFTLVMNTDFKDIDFPQNSMSPTKKIETDNGWECRWQYNNLLTGVRAGMSMPKKLNPGPWVSMVSFFAPVSLALFLFMIVIFSLMKKIDIHPVNYFFVCAAYFSFHLLLAYLVDHISIHLAFLISSLVSIFLVVSYMRIVAGKKFAFLEVGLSQFVFLVLFSYTFFFKGFTGLAITILCILTLFVAMQLTARVDWDEAFPRNHNK